MTARMLVCLLTVFFAIPINTEAGANKEYKKLIEEGDRLIKEIEDLNTENKRLAEELKPRAIEVKRVQFLIQLLEDLSNLYNDFGSINQTTLDALRKASQAHVAWIQNLRTLIDQLRPDWPNIVDLASYKTAYSRLATFKQRIADDRQVMHKEGNIKFLLSKRSKKIQEIIGRIAYINEDEKIKDLLLEKGASSLLEKTTRIKQALFDMLAQVHRPIVLMTIQQQVRRKFMIDVPRVWHRMLAGVQSRLIYEKVIAMEDEHQLMKNDPILYYDAKKKIFESGAKIGDLLFSDYCPRLALRQLMIHKVLLQDIEANLPTLPVTERIREQIGFEISGGWQVYKANKEALEYFTDSYRHFMHNSRVSGVKRVMANLKETTRELCTEQGQFLIDWEYQANVSTFDHERSYKEFMEKCTAN